MRFGLQPNLSAKKARKVIWNGKKPEEKTRVSRGGANESQRYASRFGSDFFTYSLGHIQCPRVKLLTEGPEIDLLFRSPLATVVVGLERLAVGIVVLASHCCACFGGCLFGFDKKQLKGNTNCLE